MDKIMAILLVVVIVLSFFLGNGMIIAALCGNYTIDWSEDGTGMFIFIAVVADIILLCLVMAKFIPSVSSSFRLAKSGLKNRRNAKKESANLRQLLKNEKIDVNRLQELRDKRISASATKRTLHFCQLIENIVGEGPLQDCMSEVREKQFVLDEINDIENRVFKVAEGYKNIGDIYECRYYLNILKTVKTTPEITSLENDCQEQLFQRGRENRAIRLWVKVFLGAFIFFAAVFAKLYIDDTPYRELRSMIREQTLTAEMCDWSSRNNENSYYNYLTSQKGYKLLASELSKLHRDNDVNKAMWLLCIQPDCIDRYNVCASTSFAKWIVGYAKANGIRSTDQKGADDSDFNVTYSVDGYQITMKNYQDSSSSVIDIYEFIISDGENKARIRAQIGYQKVTVPIIE